MTWELIVFLAVVSLIISFFEWRAFSARTRLKAMAEIKESYAKAYGDMVFLVEDIADAMDDILDDETNKKLDDRITHYQNIRKQED